MYTTHTPRQLSLPLSLPPPPLAKAGCGCLAHRSSGYPTAPQGSVAASVSSAALSVNSPTHPLVPICRTSFPPYVINEFFFFVFVRAQTREHRPVIDGQRWAAPSSGTLASMRSPRCASRSRRSQERGNSSPPALTRAARSPARIRRRSTKRSLSGAFFYSHSPHFPHMPRTLSPRSHPHVLSPSDSRALSTSTVTPHARLGLSSSMTSIERGVGYRGMRSSSRVDLSMEALLYMIIIRHFFTSGCATRHYY